MRCNITMLVVVVVVMMSLHEFYIVWHYTTLYRSRERGVGNLDAVSLNLTAGGVHHKPTRPTMLWQGSTRPYKDRFWFLRSMSKIDLTGPRVNPVPGMVSWRHHLDGEDVCNDTDPFILAMVISAVANSQHRHHIRHTWGSPALYHHTRIRVVFVIGKTENTTLKAAVDTEADKHNDIVQYNLIDSYKNLTHKTIAMLTWVKERCQDVAYVLKVDDDTIVNPFGLYTYLRKHTLLDKDQKTPADHTTTTLIPPPDTGHILGWEQPNIIPRRLGKWKTTKEEYPEDHFPRYVAGGAYILSRGAARTLLHYAPHVPFLWLEDVYTTGILAHAAGVPLVFVGHLYVEYPMKELYTGEKIFMMQGSDSVNVIVWKNIVDHSQVNVTL